MEKEEMINISSVLESYGMSFEVQLYSPLTGDCELVDYSNSSITIQGKKCGTAYKQCLLYEGNEDMAFIDSPF